MRRQYSCDNNSRFVKLNGTLVKSLRLERRQYESLHVVLQNFSKFDFEASIECDYIGMCFSVPSMLPYAALIRCDNNSRFVKLNGTLVKSLRLERRQYESLHVVLQNFSKFDFEASIACNYIGTCFSVPSMLPYASAILL